MLVPGISFTVPGRPVPAVRMTRDSKWLNPQAQRYLDYKAVVAWTAKQAGVQPVTGPVSLVARVYLRGKAGGDWDNYAKSLCDALNGVAWQDDRQVVDGRVVIVRGAAEDKVEIEITPASQEEQHAEA